MNKALLIGLTILLTNCATKEESSPRSAFSGEFTKRNINLQSVFTDQFILSVGQTADTFNVDFDRRERTNTITNPAGDTLFHGLVSRYKGLIYLQHPVSDSTYWLQAIRMDNGEVAGWGNPEVQMRSIDSLVNAGELEALLITKTDKFNTLKGEKRVLCNVYPSIVDRQPAMTLTTGGKGMLPVVNNSRGTQSIFEKESGITSIFPNPALTYVDVEVSENENKRLEIVNSSGTSVKVVALEELDVRIYVKDLDPGKYFIRLYDFEIGTVSDSVSFIIDRN